MIGGEEMKTPFYLMVFKTFHAQRNQIRKDMESYELSPGQPKVLRYVLGNENCMLKDIAEACDVECATVSRILTSLEEKEMLIRTIDAKNKRALKLCITEKGKHALQEWNAHCKEVEALSLKGFSEEEQEQFKQFLNRMYHNLSNKTLD